jgi:hypothetical protein
VNVLFEAPHEWRAPGESYVGSPDATFAYLDHYPGGLQNVAPTAGGASTVRGAPFGLHGGAALAPWDATVVADGPDRVAVRLTTALTRYPLRLERLVSLAAGEATLTVSTHAADES